MMAKYGYNDKENIRHKVELTAKDWAKSPPITSRI
jgi:hypothetical protein